MKKVIISKDDLLPAGIFTLCDNCPCLRCEFDKYKCSFSSNIYDGLAEQWAGIKGIVVSDNCRLIHIRYTDRNNPGHKLFIPEKVELVMK